MRDKRWLKRREIYQYFFIFSFLNISYEVEREREESWLVLKDKIR
jgi:hypothetical protein